MPDAITATQLRRDVYRVLDRVLETGEPLTIERRGQRLLLLPAGPPRRKLGDWGYEPLTDCTLEELVATHAGEWHAEDDGP